MIQRRRDLTIGQKRALWAWAFLALPVVFFVGIRFYPAAEAFGASFTNWNIVGKMEWIGVANYTRSRRTRVLEGDRQHVRVPRRSACRSACCCRSSSPTTSTACASAMAPARALFRPASDDGGRDGLGVALVLPAAAGRRVQRVAHERWACPDAVPALHDAGAAGGAGAGDLGRHRLPDRDLPGGLKAIPRTYYEAAAIDGAGAWRVLFEVTLPSLSRPSCSWWSRARSPICASSTTSTR
jgi:multiple sugar transport system permease protein